MPVAGPPTVLVRPLEPTDRQALVDGFERLSPTSRYFRFATPKPRLTGTDLRALLDVDHHDREALVAHESASGSVVAIARYVRFPDQPTTAEVAIAVVDAWQGRGVGRWLLALLARRAAEEGITRLRAEVLLANRRALLLLRRAGFVAVAWEGAMVTLESPEPVSAVVHALPVELRLHGSDLDALERTA
jgi:GNAT superfamily N-acetyltransferase